MDELSRLEAKVAELKKLAKEKNIVQKTHDIATILGQKKCFSAINETLAALPGINIDDMKNADLAQAEIYDFFC